MVASDARNGGKATGRPDAAPTLVGREAQLAVIHEAADALLSGRGGVLWVDGEPGAGKTALLDALARRVERGGAKVLRGVGDELMEDFPLRLMADCLGVVGRRAEDPARIEIAQLLRGRVPTGPGHRSESAPSGPSADTLPLARERMLALVDRQCAQGPVLLAAEDLQWSDMLSLSMWGRLARATGQIPLLLVGTARPEPRRAAVDRLRTMAGGSGPDDEAVGGHAALTLPLLTDEQVARLAETVTGAAPGARLRAELARAGGNPLYVRMLMNALLSEGLVSVGEAGTRGDAAAPGRVTAEFTGPSGATPAALADVIGRRLTYESGDAVTVLRVAALLGPRFERDLLAAVCAAEPAHIEEALGAAERAGVVYGGPQPLFCNELVREVLARQIPISMRRTLHGHIARTVAELGGSPDTVVRHLHASGEELDAWALQWLARVPEAVLGGVPAVAESLLRRAMRATKRIVVPDDAAQRQWEELAKRLADVLYLAGRDDQAIEAAQRVVSRTADSELAARMTELTVRATLRAGRWQQVVGLARDAVADEAFGPIWRSRLRALSSLALLQLGETDAAANAAAEALAWSRDSDDPLTVAMAHHAASLSEPLDRALEHIHDALSRLGDDPVSADLRFTLTANRMIWLFERGEDDRYRSLLRQLLVAGEQLGAMRTGMVLIRAALIAHLAGDWDDALDLLAGLEFEQLPPPELVRAHSLNALIHAHRGERESAARALDAAERAAAGMPRSDLSNGPIAAARSAVAEADGEPHRALELLAVLFDASRADLSSLRDEQVPVLVRMALAAKEGDLAESVAQAFERRTAGSVHPYQAAVALWCRGLLSADPEQLLAVAERMSAALRPFDAANAFQDAAVRLAAGGEGREPDAERAREALARAVRLYSEMGAEWDIRHADAMLRAHGVRRGPRTSHRRETSGWGALTVSEQRIALLVGRGWSNPDIAAELVLSRHTVQTHVSHILHKLQLRSRIEVARAVAQEPQDLPAR